MYVQSSTANCTGDSFCSTSRQAGLPPLTSTHRLENHALCMQATYSDGAVTALAQTDSGQVFLGTAAPATQISATVNDMALYTSGNARTITITNLGSTNANNVIYTPSSALPALTTITPADCGTIPASGGTCVLTITPGATASAAPYDTNATPIILTIGGDNTNSLNPSTSILNYASYYQGGYIFAIDDSTPTTGSIGGTVVATQNTTNSSVWSLASNTIPGIASNSTPNNPSPALPPPPPILTGCYGAIDGACNTNNIVTYYTYYNPSMIYSAGNCSTYNIDATGSAPCNSESACYTNWYLPAICELGSNGLCGASPPQNIATNLPGLNNYFCPHTGCLYGTYYSSTEDADNPDTTVWMGRYNQSFFQALQTQKAIYSYTRCTRALTL